jgi:hypothetical protein
MAGDEAIRPRVIRVMTMRIALHYHVQRQQHGHGVVDD